MAIIIDRNTNTSRTPAEPIETVRLAPFPVYPSENPGTPFVPTTGAPGWWEGEPTQRSHDLTSAELSYTDELEKLIESHKNLVFAKDPEFTGAHKYKNQTYAGVDMVASISLPGYGTYEFADLNTLSVSSHRENFPVRTLGMTNPMGFTQGPRTIAGSMIFSVIDAYVFYKAAHSLYGSDADSLWNEKPVGTYPLADSLPPFDITISFNNEYDKKGAALRIFGVKIIDDGMTMSVDDLVSENTYSFMALGIAPIHRVKGWKYVAGEEKETVEAQRYSGWVEGDEDVNPLAQDPNASYDEDGNLIVVV